VPRAITFRSPSETTYKRSHSACSRSCCHPRPFKEEMNDFEASEEMKVLLQCGHPKGSASPCAANVYCSSPVTSTRCLHPFRCRHQVKRRCTKSCPAPIYPRYATMLLSAILISPRYPILSDRTRFARCQQHSPDAICYLIRLL